MKNLVKVLGITSALAVAGSISVCSASAYNYITVYTTDYLRVREAPSLDAAIIDVVAPDTPVQRICKLDNGWSQVVYNDEVYYMHSDYLIEYEYAEIEESYYAEADYTEDIEDVVEYEYDTDSYYDEIIAASNFRFDGVEFPQVISVLTAWNSGAITDGHITVSRFSPAEVLTFPADTQIIMAMYVTKTTIFVLQAIFFPKVQLYQHLSARQVKFMTAAAVTT